MRAAVYHGPNALKVDDVTEPQVRPGTVKLEVGCNGICGTDLCTSTTGWAEGDRVAVEPIYKCDRCGPCREGNYNVCRQIGFHGLMSDGRYDTTGWVTTIPIGDVVDEGFEALHAGKKMKVLIDPKGAQRQ
ncbi:alcohol dehydrogenase catalytic domain-containing protein [Mycolicibacterium vaccae]|nr:alcohol dehydrogenase catalytic domain-containing protein [Mycolicibacterium vaccae]MCV7059930.1 alcohol dehydrogenase catalytic domain-containing protein [Mycolicibacterium vaccae]